MIAPTTQTVRPLTAAEIPAMLPLAEAFVAFSKMPVVFRPEKVARYWELLYRMDNGVLIGLWSGQELVGVFGVQIIESMLAALLARRPHYCSGPGGA